MAIDFSDPHVRRTYAERGASPGWSSAIVEIAGNVQGRVIVDLGCGGGIYSQAWLSLGVSRVIGVDSSAQFLGAASEAIRDDRFEVVHADAARTGLRDASADIVFARALVHHLPDLDAFVAECARILRPGGRLIVQDRTIHDVEQPPAPDHPRGYFFTVHPHLLEIERKRRPTTSAISDRLTSEGFEAVQSRTLWEERRSYTTVEEYQADIAARTGRSILYELSDGELHQLVSALGTALPSGHPVTERDRWTIWTAVKPHGPLLLNQVARSPRTNAAQTPTASAHTAVGYG